MAMDLVIESPPGTVNLDNLFETGAVLRVRAKLYETFNIPLPGIRVDVSLVGDGINLYRSSTSDWLGRAVIDLQLPNKISKPTLTIVHEYVAFVGDDRYSIPIGIGTFPGTLPKKPDEWATLKWAGGAFLVVAGLYFAAQWAPAVTKMIPERKGKAVSKGS